MAFPTVVGVGADNAGTTGAVTYVLPVHQANDILVCVVETNVTGGLTTATSGWVHVTNSPKAQGTNVTSVSVFWKRATSSSETNPVIDATSDHQAGFTIGFRGCVTSGNPWDFTPVASGTSGSLTMSATGGTTTVADCLVCIFSANNTDTAVDAYSLIINASLTNLAIQNQSFTASGNGGGCMVGTGEKATAGATGTTTATMGATSSTANIVLALKLAPASVNYDQSFDLTGSGTVTLGGLAVTMSKTVTGDGEATMTRAVASTRTFDVVGDGVVDHTKSVVLVRSVTGDGTTDLTRQVAAEKTFTVTGDGTITQGEAAIDVAFTVTGDGEAQGTKATVAAKTFDLVGDGTVTEVHPVQASRTFDLVGVGDVPISGPNGATITVPMDQVPDCPPLDCDDCPGTGTGTHPVYIFEDGVA